MNDLKKYHVFVYGTLLNMHENNARFGRGSKLVGEAETINNYFLFGGGFPLAMMPDHKAVEGMPDTAQGRIRGQMFEITKDVFLGLDAYEGFPEFYERSEIPIKTADGLEFTAWMYHGSTHAGSAATSIPSRPAMIPDDQGRVMWSKEHRSW